MFPDMVKRIKLGLVRDVSIEGMGHNFKKIFNGDGCWQKVFGLMIQMAVFVHAGADTLAKIERILESPEGDIKNLMSDMLGMMGEMKNMMGEWQVQPPAAQEAARAAIAESQGCREQTGSNNASRPHLCSNWGFHGSFQK